MRENKCLIGRWLQRCDLCSMCQLCVFWICTDQFYNTIPHSFCKLCWKWQYKKMITIIIIIWTGLNQQDIYHENINDRTCAKLVETRTTTTLRDLNKGKEKIRSNNRKQCTSTCIDLRFISFSLTGDHQVQWTKTLSQGNHAQLITSHKGHKLWMRCHTLLTGWQFSC